MKSQIEQESRQKPQSYIDTTCLWLLSLLACPLYLAHNNTTSQHHLYTSCPRGFSSYGTCQSASILGSRLAFGQRCSIPPTLQSSLLLVSALLSPAVLKGTLLSMPLLKFLSEFRHAISQNPCYFKPTDRILFGGTAAPPAT